MRTRSSDSSLNREILRLAIPSILANITVPLVGMVDTAVAGHLSPEGGASAADYIGSIAIGAMVLNMIYWLTGFLRTGAGGLTAQAFGQGNMHEAGRIFGRSNAIAITVSVLILALQWPFGRLVIPLTGAEGNLLDLAIRYFFVRIWAAPATIMLMAYKGWFVGMQDSMSSMFTDLVINVTNIAASILLSFGLGSWEGLGFDGIAYGTVLAQYTGLAFASILIYFRYNDVFQGLELREFFDKAEMRDLLSMNGDLFVRSLCFTVIYLGETMIAAGFGSVFLACNAILMNLLMVFSYFTDGFAYAGEALTGRFIGARDKSMTIKTVRLVFIWAMGVAAMFMGIYALSGIPLVKMMTSDPVVVEACRQFLPWLLLMPPLGCAAFTWDGIFLGATASKGTRDGMIAAMVSFLLVWYLGKVLFQPQDASCLHLLMGAYFAHLLARTVLMSLRYRKEIISPLN